jgi:hypothetical protein
MERQRKPRGGNNWIGLVIFLVVMFGSPLSSFVSGLIFQATGVSVSSGVLVIGLIVVAVAVSLVGSAVRSAGRFNIGSETRLPSGPTSAPQMSAPPSRPAQLPPSMSGSGLPPAQLPGGPRYEPVINPRILAIGVAGLLLFGVIFLAILAMSGAI